MDYTIQIKDTTILIEGNSFELYKKFLERCGLYYDRLFDWEKWEECEIMHGTRRIASSYSKTMGHQIQIYCRWCY